jgi:hypothetical protein
MAIVSNKDETAYILTDKSLLVSFRSSLSLQDSIGNITKVTSPTNNVEAEVKFWGKKNDLPTQREQLLSESPVAPTLIGTKQRIGSGLDLFAYVKKIDKGVTTKEEVLMPTDIYDFLAASGDHQYFDEAFGELEKHANVFTHFPDTAGNATGIKPSGKLTSMRILKSKHTRAEQQDDNGMIPSYFWRGDGWVVKPDEKKTFPIIKFPTYNPLSIDPQTGFVYHTGYRLFSDEYYFIPSWWGARLWIELAQIIATFHLKNLQNSYSIKYHIEILDSYFDDGVNNSIILGEPELKLREAKRKAAKKNLLKSLNDFLAGYENAGRAVVTERLNRFGAIHSGVVITPLKVDLQDEALLKLAEEARKNLMSSMNVHPTLANIETQGKLASGTEIRNAYLMHLAIHAPMSRRIILEPLYIAKKINGWQKDIEFGFRDMLLTTLSDTPTGTKTSNGN